MRFARHMARRSSARGLPVTAPLVALVASTLLSIFATSSLAAQAAPARQTVVGEGQRITATLTPGIRVGNQLWASGQLGTAPGDTTIGGLVAAAGTSCAGLVHTASSMPLQDCKGMQGLGHIAC